MMDTPPVAAPTDSGPRLISYESSGLVDWLRFGPLFLVATAVALLMAFVLNAARDGFYYFIIVPIVVALPVVGALYGAIQLGRCRNRILGAAAGLVLITVFYVGFWQVAYQLDIVRRGPRAVAAVERLSGAPGLLGYFIFSCEHTPVEAHPGGSTKEEGSGEAYIFYGLEALLMAILGPVCGWMMAGRIFYEPQSKWAKSQNYRFRPDDFAAALAAIRAGDWTALGKLPRLPRQTDPKSAYVDLKVEYLPGAEPAPMYLTLTGTNMSRHPAAKAEGAGKFTMITKSFLKQAEIPAELARSLALSLGELQVTWPTADPNDPSSAAGIPPAVKRVEYESGFKGALQRTGLAQPKFAGPDFREAAVAESAAMLAARGSFVDPQELGRSLCLAVEGFQEGDLKKASTGRVKALLLGFIPLAIGLSVLLPAGAMLDEAQRTKTQSPLGIAIFVTGCVLTLGAVVYWIALSNYLMKRSLAKRLTRRPGSLFSGSTPLKTMYVTIENPATFHVMKVYQEDVGIAAFDPQNGLLRIEGVKCRYLIRREDIVRLEPLLGASSSAVDLAYQVGEQTLALVLMTPSLMAGYPNRPIWMSHPSKAFGKKVRKMLGMPKEGAAAK